MASEARPRPLLIVGVAIAALLVALLAWAYFSDPPPLVPPPLGGAAGATAGSRAGPLADRAAVELAEPAGASRREERRALAPEAATDPTAAAAAEPRAVGDARFHGTLEMRDADDRPLPPPDATLGVVAVADTEGDSSPPRLVEVRAGAFDALLPIAARYYVASVQTGGQSGGQCAWLETPLLEASAAPHALIARLARATTLRVTDAGSGALLQEVFVTAPEGPFDRPSPDQCEPDQLIVRSAPSPLVLPLPDPRREPTLLWRRDVVVGAPDHASVRIDLDLKNGGERLVPLERGATVTVAVEPWRLPPSDPAEGVLVARPLRPTVRLRHVDALDPARPESEHLVTITHWAIDAEARPDPRGRVRFEGVKPGSVTVSVELSDWRAEEPALSFAQFELAAGEERAVTLRMPELATPLRAAPLAGIVQIDPAWDDLPWALEIRRASDDDPRRLTLSRGELELEHGSAGRWRFRIPAVTPGTWIARVAAIERQFVFEQPPSGRSDLLLVVGPPVEARLELRDAATREPIELEGVHLQVVRPDPQIREWRSIDARWNAATRRYHARVPRDRYALSIADWRYGEPRGEFDLTAEKPSVAFDLERNGGLRVRLRVGETVLPTSEAADRARLAWSDGRGAATRYYYEPEHVRIVPSRYGTATLTLRPPPGCKAPPDREVELRAGEFVEVDVVFERE
ncbi:MAG: hypothetical protein JNL90_00540 [Planctomycetes bacterium]|nr:hypothetical protein [Planctomycetota bacterium]